MSDVTANYTSSQKKDVIGTIEAAGTYYYKIVYAGSEDSISITYLDKNQKYHTVLAAPYVASYDKQHYTVIIN